VRTVSVRPGAIQRITVSTVPLTLVRALVTFSTHQSLSLFGMTDNRGRMSLVVRVPRTIKLHNGQARAQVAVWTVNARRQAEATVLLTISDMVVGVVGSRISRCQQTDAVQVAYYPNVPLRLQLLLPKGHSLTRTTRTDKYGTAVMQVQMHYVKVTGTLRIGVLVSDARPRSHRMERMLLTVSVPRTCQW
jgi:hypothetical protein